MTGSPSDCSSVGALKRVEPWLEAAACHATLPASTGKHPRDERRSFLTSLLAEVEEIAAEQGEQAGRSFARPGTEPVVRVLAEATGISQKRRDLCARDLQPSFDESSVDRPRRRGGSRKPSFWRFQRADCLS